MDWRDTREQAAFRDEVRRFIAERFPEQYRPDHQREQSLEPEDVHGYDWAADRLSDDPERREGAREWARALAERGWVAPHWPVDYGGAALSVLEELILHEEMMRAGVPTVNGIAVFLMGPTLLAHGSDEQKAEHLPRISSGEEVWAQAFSEPEAGSDLANVYTKAVREGDEYVVNGQKVWTSLAQFSDWMMVLVRTDPKADRRHRGITFLMVEADTPGVIIRPVRDLRGAEPFAEVFFDDVRVPVSNRVGEENKGFYVAMTTLGFERSGIGATIKYEKALARLIELVRSSQGAPYRRGDFGDVIRHEIAQRSIEVRVLRNLALRTISKQAAGEAPDYEASINQLFSAELHQRLAHTGTLALGPYGNLLGGEEAPLDGTIAHLRQDAVAATFLAGTTEIQRNVIATRGLGLPR